MSYRTPQGRRRMVEDAYRALLTSRRAILTTHVNADGDGAGSQAALASWMNANGAETAIINPTSFPKRYRWMVEDQRSILGAGSLAARDRSAAADLAVVLDTCDIGRLGTVWRLVRGLRTLVIDHHQLGPRPVGGMLLTDPEACAAGELVYDIVLSAGGPWTKHVLDGLYVAISTDTGSYRFDNATPAAHLVTADLVARGVRPGAVSKRLYGSAPLTRYELLRESLATLRSEYGVTWMIVPPDAYLELGAGPEDLEGLIDVPRSVAGTEIGMLFRVTRGGAVKVSFRASGEADVHALAGRFGGGGHRKASGALVEGPLERVVSEVLEQARATAAKAKRA